jgi:hypothetical protein
MMFAVEPVSRVDLPSDWEATERTPGTWTDNQDRVRD